MTRTFTRDEDPEAFEWLANVHGVDTDCAEVFVLYGNEDSPTRVDVYTRNDVNCEPIIWLQDESGRLRLPH